MSAWTDFHRANGPGGASGIDAPSALPAPSTRMLAVAIGSVAVLGLVSVYMSVGSPTAAPLTVPAFQASGCAQRGQARLFFGLQGPTGLVSDLEWETFLADVVTPRFPNGLTVVQASGQWRGAGDRLQREPARVVEIVHDESPDAWQRLDRIVTLYKARYQQQSVMVARTRIDVCF